MSGAAPANDNFSSATSISGSSGQTTSSNVGATKESSEPSHAGKHGEASVWWRWTALSSGSVTIDTNGSNFDTVLAVYTGSSVGGLSEVVSDDDGGDGAQSLVTFDAVSGTTYRIAVDGYNSDDTGNIVLNWSFDGPPPPANNNFTNSTSISGSSGQTTGSNVGATKESSEPSHAGNSGGASVWWQWTVPSSGSVTINTNGSDFDTVLAVYTGSSVGGLSEVVSDDDGGDGAQSLVTFDAVSGTIYRIAVDGFNGDTGNIVLQWSLSVPPPPAGPVNDNFSGSVSITGSSGQTTGSNVGATKESGEPSHVGNGGGASVWWKWTAPSSGSVTIDTNGSNFDTVLAVYTGSSVGGLSEVVSDNDGGDGAQSLVTFDAVSGTTYHIAVDGFNGDTGNIELQWNLSGLFLLLGSETPDFNGDGKTDILWRRSTTGSCLIQLMNGTSTIIRGTVGGDLTWEIIGLGDFNYDNHTDILWRKMTTGSCLIQLMDGVSTIGRGIIGGDLTWEVVELGDFDNDGKDDILWRRTTTGSCLIQLMNGISTKARGTIGGDLTWEVVELGDFDNDGKDDILWRRTTTGNCLIQLMNGLSTKSRGTIGGDLTWEPYELGDFNGDNKTDILWRRTTTGSCLIQLMNGVSTISRGTVGGDLTWEPCDVGDFNGDNKSDILWRRGTTGSCLIQLMNGVSTLSRGTVGGDLTWNVLISGDFNGDNKADILWRKTTTGSCLIQLMNGTSTISRGTVGGDLTWEPIVP
jgi:hypothetical protein